MDAMAHSMVTSFDGRMARFGEELRSKVACIRLGGRVRVLNRTVIANISKPKLACYEPTQSPILGQRSIFFQVSADFGQLWCC